MTKLKNVTLNQHCEVSPAFEAIADAIQSQAEANRVNSQALIKLAGSLNDINIAGISISQAKEDIS